MRNGLVRVAPYARKGNSLEYEIRRVTTEEEIKPNLIGLLNWSPMYVPIQNVYPS